MRPKIATFFDYLGEAALDIAIITVLVGAIFGVGALGLGFGLGCLLSGPIEAGLEVYARHKARAPEWWEKTVKGESEL